MSFKDIQALRKEGQLDEALEMATQALVSDPQNIWNKRAASWVYYDLLKKFSDVEHYDLFLKYLKDLKELELPENEKMVFDNAAWQFGSIVFALQKEKLINYSRINDLFDTIKTFHFTKPSESYSFVYKAFHKGYKNWSRYLEFADWWGFKNFQAADYLEEEYNGRKIMAIVEQAFIAYSKKLLEGIEGSPNNLNNIESRVAAESFLTELDEIIDKHPEYQYPPYYKAKLLLALGSNENVLSEFMPFAKQKRNDFWVWELMAEILPDGDPRVFQCYCKALGLKAPEDFLIKTRENFAALLVERGLHNEAKTEIQKVLSVRQEHNWRTSQRINLWIQSEWYQNATSFDNNAKLYREYAPMAEAILFEDIPEELVAVEFVNSNKNILNFVIDKDNHGFFKYPRDLNPKIGDILRVKFDNREENGFQKTFSIKQSQGEQLETAIKEFKGDVNIRPQNPFGFVHDIFLDPGIVDKFNITDGDQVEGRAILSYNKKKDEWGWKCFMINRT